jgi:hypothetical protein
MFGVLYYTNGLLFITLISIIYFVGAEVESGCTLTTSGEIRVLSKEEWEEKKRRYEEALRGSE